MTTCQEPDISVILPVRNEGKTIARCLDQLFEQASEQLRLQIIIVDGLSTDDTVDQVQSILATLPPFVEAILLANPDRTAPHALNRGLRVARARFILRLDGHTEVPPDLLVSLRRSHDRWGADCVGPALLTRGRSITGAAIAQAQSSRLGVGGSAFRTSKGLGKGPIPVDTVAFGMYRSEVFARLGEFDTDLTRNQDDEFNFRLTQSGGTILMDPGVVVTYFCRDSLRSLARQYFEYGLFKMLVNFKRGGLSSARQLAPPALVVSFLAAVGFGICGNRRPLARLSVLYGLVLVAGTERYSGGSIRTRGTFAMAVATMHFSYGAGYLAGLFKWAPRYLKVSDHAS